MALPIVLSLVVWNLAFLRAQNALSDFTLDANTVQRGARHWRPPFESSDKNKLYLHKAAISGTKCSFFSFFFSVAAKTIRNVLSSVVMSLDSYCRRTTFIFVRKVEFWVVMRITYGSFESRFVRSKI